MLYFFHHYELPALLQGAQLQFGRLHTMNIVLRNVPSTENTNGRNAGEGGTPNATGNLPAGAGNAAGETGNNRLGALVDDQRIVNLILRSITTADRIANHRGNISLRFLFRNLRNFGSSGNTNSETSTNTSNSTSPSNVTSSVSSTMNSNNTSEIISETSPLIGAEGSTAVESQDLGIVKEDTEIVDLQASSSVCGHRHREDNSLESSLSPEISSDTSSSVHHRSTLVESESGARNKTSRSEYVSQRLGDKEPSDTGPP